MISISVEDIVAAMLREQNRVAVRRGSTGEVVLIEKRCSWCAKEKGCGRDVHNARLGCKDFKPVEV